MRQVIPETYLARASRFIDRHLDLRDMRSVVALAMMEAEQRIKAPRVGLTHQQLAALDFIEKHQAEHRVAPSYDEIRAALGLQSKSGVHRLVHALKERGAIVMIDGRTRSMSVRRAA